MLWFARLTAISAAAVVVLLTPTAAVAARPAPPVATDVSVTMSDEQASPEGWKGCLVTVSADVTASDKGRLSLTWYVGLRAAPGAGSDDLTVNVGRFASTAVTPGQTHYALTPEIWFNSTTEVVSVYATLSKGRHVVATSDTQTVSLICPSPFPPL